MRGSFETYNLFFLALFEFFLWGGVFVYLFTFVIFFLELWWKCTYVVVIAIGTDMNIQIMHLSGKSDIQLEIQVLPLIKNC